MVASRKKWYKSYHMGQVVRVVRVQSKFELLELEEDIQVYDVHDLDVRHLGRVKPV